MKKILVTLAIFAIVGSVLTAQNAKFTASNEIYSETIYKEANGTADDMANGDVAGGFWGFREQAEGKVETETWTIQARLRQRLASLHETDNFATDAEGNPRGQSVNGDNWENVYYNNNDLRLAFWYRPLAGIELGVGNHFAGYYTVPAGSMLGSDQIMGYLINSGLPFPNGDAKLMPGDDFAGARWAKDGFALNVTKVPNLLVSVNIPYMNIVKEYDFAPAINVGAHYTIRDNINIGVTYHGGINPKNGHVFGLYGQFKKDSFRIPLGVTFGYRAKKTQTWVDYADKARIEIDFAPDFTFRNGMQVGLSVSWGMMFGSTDKADDVNNKNVPAKRNLMPLVVGLYYKWPINNAWTFDVRTWFELALNAYKAYGGGDGSFAQFYINPKIAYKINAHNEVSVGVKLRHNFALGDNYFGYMGYAVPVAWKWTL